ncbi:MAG TPA: prepilin-type N-terminal cleavage/methylation domain-containing protein [Acidimicrobiales bacterium]|nr:prepilin-type N-terminal cleavage/methylation domain-containing protein [Acidimicrobiales bacterium]
MTYSPPQATNRSTHHEHGDTLIEVLIAVVIIAIAAAALLGGLTTALTASGEHKGLSVDDTLLKSYAEAAKQQIEISQSVAFTQCTPSTYAIAYTVPAQFSTYTVAAQSVTFWNSGSKSFSTTCNHVKPDEGIQLITVTATAPQAAGGYTQTLSFVVRDPNYET